MLRQNAAGVIELVSQSLSGAAKEVAMLIYSLGTDSVYIESTDRRAYKRSYLIRELHGDWYLAYDFVSYGHIIRLCLLS